MAIGLVIFAFYVVHLLQPILSLLILASLIAFVANPTIRFLHRQLKIPRGAAVAITYLLASLLILLVPVLLFPQVVNAVNFLLRLDYADLINNLRNWAQTTLVQLRDSDLHVLGVTIVMDQIVDPVLATIQNVGPVVPPTPPSLSTLFSSLGPALTNSLVAVVGVAGSVVANVASFVLMILTSIYLSQDAYKIRDLMVNNLPLAYQPEIASLLFRLQSIWNHYLRSQLLLMLTIGVLVWLGAAILGLPGAFALGIVSAVLELLPNVGPVLAIIPAVIVALTQGSTHFALSNGVFTLIVVAFYFAVQEAENFLIVPRLMSKEVNVHPLVVILGVFVGTLSFGILGAILAVPAIATASEIIKYLYMKIRGLAVDTELPVEPAPFAALGTLAAAHLLKQKPAVPAEGTAAEGEKPQGSEKQ